MDKNRNNRIFIRRAGGVQDFQNRGHAQNFVKYLFSQSSKHQPNERTQFNFYVIPNGDRFIVSFVDDPEKNLAIFRQSIEGRLDNYRSLQNELYYVAFFIAIDDVLYSNMLFRDEDTDDLFVPNEHLEFLADEYYDGNQSVARLEIDSIMKKFKHVMPFEECARKARKAIEIKIHKMLVQKLMQPENMLISMSHVDQDQLYHVHLLY